MKSKLNAITNLVVINMTERPSVNYISRPKSDTADIAIISNRSFLPHKPLISTCPNEILKFANEGKMNLVQE